MKKERIDVMLVNKGLVKSRSQAKKYIEDGFVYVDGNKIDKPSFKVEISDDTIEIKGNPIPYVSRGGLKLEKALNAFNINIQDKIALDIGASTGGFTDCMLQNSIKRVYAIDVGYNQLSPKIKSDPRVISIEKTNVRYMNEHDIDIKAQFASIDVSFISLSLILPAVNELTTFDADIVALIKPQFEAGKDRIGKNGIVKDIKVHKQVIKELYNFCKNINLYFNALTFSPIKGGKGNIEYLVHLVKSRNNIKINDLNIDSIILDITKKSHVLL